MTFKSYTGVVCFLAFASAALPAFSAERHNVVLLVPSVLPSAAVDHSTAPTLARLRAEGVYFSNSHSGFPQLANAGAETASSHLDVAPLIAAASASYSTAMVDDARPTTVPSLVSTSVVEESSSLDTIVRTALPRFKAANRPFVLVYRFGSTRGDTEETARPITYRTGGEDEPSLLSAVQAADHALTAIEGALRDLGLYDTTNIIVAAEQGTSFVWKASATSETIQGVPTPARWGSMPTGFLAVDLAAALAKKDSGVSLFDPDDGNRRLATSLGEHPKLGNGMIAISPGVPIASVEAQGDHGLVYLSEDLSKKDIKRHAQTIIDAVFKQDYAGGVFVNESRVGKPRGTLSLRHIGWDRSTTERVPDIVITFISKSLECSRPTLCAANIADTPTSEGQQLSGSFNRADTWNFMAARGPSFQERLFSEAPASTADIVKTLGELMRVSSALPAHARARVLTESLRGHEESEPKFRKHVIASKPTPAGVTTEVHLQSVGSTKYFYAAGLPGWTVGIAKPPEPIEWRPWRWNWPRIKGIRMEISSEDPKIDPYPPLQQTVER